MKRCVLVSGASISDLDFAKKYLRPEDFNIFCDCGLRHAKMLGIKPDLVVGDMDSFTGELPECEMIKLPAEKDDTDTFFAAKEAMRRGFDEVLMLGAIGERFDHTMGNISVLMMLSKSFAEAKIIYDRSEISVISSDGDSNAALIDDGCRYFSLIAAGGPARGITIENAKYPLENGVITPEYQYGISNEVLPGKTAKATVTDGTLIVVKIY